MVIIIKARAVIILPKKLKNGISKKNVNRLAGYHRWCFNRVQN
jgi:hypothetical protein